MIHLLGPVELSGQGPVPRLGSDKARLVLASLAMDPGRPVSLETLVHRLWEDHPPGSPRENLHTYVSRIRRALRSAQPDPRPGIGQRAHTYTLDIDQDSVDWHRYRRLTSQAAESARDGDAARAVARLREADGLWRGTPLAGLPGSWAASARLAMEGRRRSIITSRIGWELRLGRYAELAGELASIVEQHPSDETLIGQFMIACYGSGRHAEALDVYQRARRTLREEFGADVGDELARIHRSILRRTPVGQLSRAEAPEATGRQETVREAAGHGTAAHDTAAPEAAAGGAAARETVAVTEHPAPPDNLPRHTPLVGRRGEMRRLRRAISESGEHSSAIVVESISGMAGVGKSCLAVNAGHALREFFPDGRLFLDLRAHTAPHEPMSAEAALGSLLRLAGVPAGRLPTDASERAAMWRGHLAGTRTLVILDDAADAEQVRPLLPESPPSLALITSRSRLVGLSTIRSLALDVLPRDDAVALFQKLAYSGERDRPRPGARTEEDAEVARIVHQCGYLPLAIEIVAGRLATHPSWTLRELSERLARAPGRLVEIERLLEDLLTGHLLQEPSPHRFRYHDLLGEYARTLCSAEGSENGQDGEEEDGPDREDGQGGEGQGDGEGRGGGEGDRDDSRTPAADGHATGGHAAALARLVDFYLHTAHRCDALLHPSRAATGLPGARPLPGIHTPEAARDWLTAELPNLLSAHRYARTHGMSGRAARLADALAGYLDAEAHWGEAVQMHEHAVAHWERGGEQHALRRALLDLSSALSSTARYEAADTAGRTALRLAREARDTAMEVEALRVLGVLHWHLGENRIALVFHKRSLELCHDLGDLWTEARCRNNTAITQLYLGEYTDALRNFQESLTGFRASGDTRNFGKTLNNLGDLYRNTGEQDSARLAYEEALHIAEHSGSRADIAIAQANIAEILVTEGANDEGRKKYGLALLAFRALGDRKNEAAALCGIGRAHFSSAAYGTALEHARQSLGIARSIGATDEEVQALRLTGQVELARDRPALAADHLVSALAAAKRTGAREEVARIEEELAEARERTGRPEEARRLREHAATLLREPGYHGAGAGTGDPPSPETGSGTPEAPAASDESWTSFRPT